jgi:hypothetical protein
VVLTLTKRWVTILREVGTIRVDGVRFRVYAGDHDGSSVAHVHAMFDRGEVAIELFRDGTVGLSRAHRELSSVCEA